VEPDLTPADVEVLRAALAPHAGAVAPGLWRRLEDARETQPRRIRAACALATLDPDNPRWRKVSHTVVGGLLADNRLWLGRWAEQLRPARRWLLGPLGEVLRSRQRPADRAVVTDILLDYGGDDPEVLAELLMEADAPLLARLRGRLLAHREQVTARLERELDRALSGADSPLDPSWKAPDPELVRRLTAAHGLITERFALCQTLPLAEVIPLAEGLHPAGYRPVRLRPYAAGGTTRVAALWRRDGRTWRVVTGMPGTQQFHEHDRKWRARGLVPADVAVYWDAEARRGRCAALWVQEKDASEHRVYLGVHQGRHRAEQQRLKGSFYPLTIQAVTNPHGVSYYSAVWRRLTPGSGRPGWQLVWDEAEEAYRSRFVQLRQEDIDVVLRPPAREPADVTAWLAARPGAGLAGLPWGGLARAAKRGTPALESRFAGVWHQSEARPEKVLGQEPASHLEYARELAARGFRPAALSAAASPDGRRIVAASVWHPPPLSEEARDALAARQAQAAVLLFQLGRPERVWPLLRHGPDPRVRSFLLERLELPGTDPEALWRRLDQEHDVSARRALILSLGGLPAARRRAAAERLLSSYRDDPDPGVHSAADWLLRRWGYDQELRAIDGALASAGPRGGAALVRQPPRPHPGRRA
jgi:hypothetical protein